MPITCILFDLGNVLLLHNAQRRIAALARECSKDDETIINFLTQSGIVDRLDTGHADEADLADTLSTLAGHPVSATDAVRLWLTVFELNAPLWAKLSRLYGRYRLGIFSNNPPFIQNLFPKGAAFDHIFLSAHFGRMKPDPAIFAAVQKELDLQPREIAFVDDKKENTDRACALGWNGVVFKSNVQLENDFHRLEIW